MIAEGKFVDKFEFLGGNGCGSIKNAESHKDTQESPLLIEFGPGQMPGPLPHGRAGTVVIYSSRGNIQESPRDPILNNSFCPELVDFSNIVEQINGVKNPEKV